MTTGELARNFSEWFPANTQVAYQAWLPGDVVSLLKQRTGKENPFESEETLQSVCNDVLDRMERNKDASLGMSWDTLQYTLDDVLYDRKLLHVADDED